MAQKAHSHFKYITAAALLIFTFSSCSINKSEEENSSSSFISEFITNISFIPEDTITSKNSNLILNNGIYYLDSIPFSGYIKENYQDGNVNFISSFLNGMLHGVTTSFYPDEKIREIRNYKENKSFGKQIGYWENGNQKFEYIYIDDKRNGLNKQWYESGSPYAFLNFKDDKESGLQQAWRENGKLYINYETKDGFRYGLQKSGLCYTLVDQKIITEK